MKKQTRIPMARIFFLSLFFLSCIGACTATQVHKATEEQNGSRINLKMGDRLQIALEGNPTTGYTWEIAQNNSDLLEPEGEVGYQAEKTNLVGSGGTFIFTFNAIARGNTSLKLIYWRPFEKDLPPIKEYRLTILVE
jgi:inhibitor of cysteine peptidase